MNTHLRDNLLETAPAKVAAAGDTIYATGANALTRLAAGTAYQLLRMNSGATAPEWASNDYMVVQKASETTTDTLTADTEILNLSLTAPRNGGTLYAVGWSFCGRDGGDFNMRWKLYLRIDGTDQTAYQTEEDYNGVGVCVGSKAVSSGARSVGLRCARTAGGNNVLARSKGILAFWVSA